MAIVDGRGGWDVSPDIARQLLKVNRHTRSLRYPDTYRGSRDSGSRRGTRTTLLANVWPHSGDRADPPPRRYQHGSADPNHIP